MSLIMSEDLKLPILSPKYQGNELVKQLSLTWPMNVADSPVSSQVCSAAAVLRWIACVLENDTPEAPKLGPSHPLMAFSLSEFPVLTDQKIAGVFHDAISRCSSVFYGTWPEDYNPNLSEMLESEPILECFWSKPYNLLYKTPLWTDFHGTIDQVEWPIDQIAKAGLIRINDPRELATTVKQKLGLFNHIEQDTYLFLSPTPPQLIRVRWDNKSNSSFPKTESAFKALQEFTLSAQCAQLEADELSFHPSTTGYRLICAVKIPGQGEDQEAPHFYACDGRYFIPPTRGLKCDWSCNEPGSYYLIYNKSDAPRRMSLERAVSFPSIEEARSKGLSGVTTKSDPPAPVAPKPAPKTPFDRRRGSKAPYTPRPRASTSTPTAPSTDTTRRRILPPRPSQVPTGPRALQQASQLAPEQEQQQTVQQAHRQVFDFTPLPPPQYSQYSNEVMAVKRKSDADAVQIRQTTPSQPRKRRKSDHHPDSMEKEPWKNWRE
ncbi:hypothetical protein Hte_002931 [Hypoxylon texense]